MRIKDRRAAIIIRDLPNGATFASGSSVYYIKLYMDAGLTPENGKMYAANLSSGLVMKFDENDKVYPVEAELNIL